MKLPISPLVGLVGEMSGRTERSNVRRQRWHARNLAVRLSQGREGCPAREDRTAVVGKRPALYVAPLCPAGHLPTRPTRGEIGSFDLGAPLSVAIDEIQAPLPTLPCHLLTTPWQESNEAPGIALAQPFHHG